MFILIAALGIPYRVDQYVIAKFGESFELVARTLAENAGLNPMEIISKLYEKHASGNGIMTAKPAGGPARRDQPAEMDED
ncbi:hypothetical protein PVK06_041727 [Gossypium arboreum]|uniref:Uncharacterized protein n=1 Tax=Gossypium arboreum TaxID=29729 RepID=A0ABR0N928_GOSAR|nr:hypothetical protein PVK06_041727 [Gossypium arboreum]